MIEVKEIKFRPKVDEHDYQFKKKHIERFLEDGDKVKATIFFRGREMAHPGNRPAHSRTADWELSEVALAETMPRMEGNQMHTILTRRPQGGGGKAKAAAPARGERANATTERRIKSERIRWRKKIKLKTHRGAAKRFKRTKNGKFLRGKAFKQHILSSKTRKRKRGLRGTTTVADVDAPKLARMLPYK